MMNTTKFEARLIGSRNGVLFFRKTDNTNNELIRISEEVMYNDCIFPDELCDSAGKLKMGCVLHLYLNNAGRVYPDKGSYKQKRSFYTNNNEWTTNDQYALQFIPRLPYYRKAIIKILLNRINELGKDAVEAYIDGLVCAKEETIKKIYTDLHIPLFEAEGLCTEYKSSLRYSAGNDPGKNQNRIIAKSIAGMFNSGLGGQLIVGITDQHQVVGLNNEVNPSCLNEIEGQLRNSLSQLLNNRNAVACLKFEWFRDWNEKILLKIKIPANYEDVILVAEHFLYLRTGSNTQLLGGQDMIKYMMKKKTA